MPLLDVRDLTVEFRTPAGPLRAVDGLSFGVDAGESLAIVGESGSGKSVTARAIMGLLPEPPECRVDGAIRFEGVDLRTLDEARLRDIRGNHVAMIFQEPMTSLNPLLSIGTQLRETLRTHLGLGRAAADARAAELLEMVGIPEPARQLRHYPHHLSGGMRQRVMIAMALSCEPRVIIADEPTTALDVTIQQQILELMRDLTRRLDVALVLITHNLGLVARYCDRVNVMYAARIVESGATREIFARPRHPYTIGLIRSVPRLDLPKSEPLTPIAGQAPDLARLGPGCPFRPRCAWAVDTCAAIRPELAEVFAEHRSACLRREEL